MKSKAARNTKAASPPLDALPLVASVTTAARYLDASRAMLYNHMTAGNIKFIPYGADRRIPREEIQRIAREGLPKLPPATKAGTTPRTEPAAA